MSQRVRDMGRALNRAGRALARAARGSGQSKINARRRAAGVTLVEVLVVVAIMAMLATGVGLYVLPKFRQTQIDTARNNAHSLRKAVESWQLSNTSECPTVSELIESKEIDSASNPDDPWGQEFQITCADDEVTVTSSGPDAKKGTEDDIQVPNRKPRSEG
jgi:general secretion pathway protein G